MKFKYLPLLLTASLALPFTACDDDDFEDPAFVPVSSMTASGSETLKVGDSKQIVVNFEPLGATAKNIQWKSSNGAVASVNGSGLVSALKVGTATITGTTPEGKSVSCNVTVTKAQLVFCLNDKANKTDNSKSTILRYLDVEGPTDVETLLDLTTSELGVMGISKYFAGWSNSNSGDALKQYEKEYEDNGQKLKKKVFYETAKQDTLFAVWKERDAALELANSAWAALNLGAKAAQETGSLYAWGEKSTKDAFNWGNYAFGDALNLKKYCSDATIGAKYITYKEDGKTIDKDYSAGYTDGLTSLVEADDAAFVASYKWKTPTKADFENLFSEGFAEYVTNFQNYEGVNGWVIYKKSDKKAADNTSIFLPEGTYWTSELTSDDAKAVCVKITKDGIDATEVSADRCNGLLIRPILVK